MLLSKIEQSIKRSLSEAEMDAIDRVKIHLPADRRQAKRLLRQARERARKKELASMKRAGKIVEPTDEDLRLALSSLSMWQPPAQFIGSVRKLGQRVPTERLWGNRYKRLREAMTLAGLCEHCHVQAVRMGDDPPDAWLRVTDQDEPIEITEVLEPDRRRGDEYRRGGAAPAVFVPHSQLTARAKFLSSQLEKAIEAKVGKYDFKPRLLIYLNFPYGRAEAQVQTAIADMRSKYADEFQRIDIVTDTKLL